MDAEVPATDELYDCAPCGLLVAATNGAIVKVNQTFCSWVGYSRADLVGHKRLQDLFTMGGKIFHQTHWVPTLQMQGSLAEVKFEVQHRDGRKIPMLLNARRQERPGGPLDEISAIVAEDRTRYERELMNARKRADALVESERQAQQQLQDRALFAEQMVGIVSHDLRNPLSAILLGIKLLERVDNDRRSSVLGHVRHSAERAQRLIEELLDFTQARLGKGLQVNVRVIDLHQMARNAIEELRLAYPHREIAHVASGEGRCCADEGRLAQLVINLVGNAVAYGDSSAILVGTAVKDGLGIISVHNEGSPISAHMLETIFEPMVRGVPGSSTHRSVGLGLFIVNQIARAHHGTMTVESQEGSGTTFTLTFPAEPGSDG